MSEACFKNCCYSTPPLTLTAAVIAAVGLLGFTISAAYGIAELDTVQHLENSTVVLAPVVGGMVVLTILPLVFATILACCITGYVRDVLFHKVVKGCIGPFCNIVMVIMVFVSVVLWLLFIVGLSGIMTYYIQAELKCDHIDGSGVTSCFGYVDTSFEYFEICSGDGLEELCDDGLKAGLAFSISLFFALIITMGLVAILAIQGANFISAKDNMEYRKNTNHRNDGYLMKDVR